MDITNKTHVVKDFKEKTILISREFNAPLPNVWRAYTESELLDQWWGPHPWKAETKRMDFRVGGHWLYAMVGPDNTRHWGIMSFTSIDTLKSIGFEDGFCDEDGTINSVLPVSRGFNVFEETPNGTRVSFRMTYPNETDLQTIVEMGFEQGITACFEQLDQLFHQNKI